MGEKEIMIVKTPGSQMGSPAAAKSKDSQFAAVKLPKCLEGPHNTYDRSTKAENATQQKQEQGWAQQHA